MLLLVDDDDVLGTYKNILELNDFYVLPAATPAEALTQFMTHQGDISAVITDYHMPAMSGVELIQTIRQYQPSMPTFLISGGLAESNLPNNITIYTKTYLF
jgi:DNA-binding NtrC family response regulator